MFERSLSALLYLDSAAQKLPIAGHIRGKILDILFGPVDDHEYVSTTSNAAPPPAG